MALRQFARTSAPLFRLQSAAPLLSTSLSRNYSTGEGARQKRGFFWPIPRVFRGPSFCCVWHQVPAMTTDRTRGRVYECYADGIVAFCVLPMLTVETNSDRRRVDRPFNPFKRASQLVETLFCFFVPCLRVPASCHRRVEVHAVARGTHTTTDTDNSIGNELDMYVFYMVACSFPDGSCVASRQLCSTKNHLTLRHVYFFSLCSGPRSRVTSSLSVSPITRRLNLATWFTSSSLKWVPPFLTRLLSVSLSP